jgi:hypothetical protein
VRAALAPALLGDPAGLLYLLLGELVDQERVHVVLLSSCLLSLFVTVVSV